MKKIIIGVLLLLCACGDERPSLGLAPPPKMPSLPATLDKKAGPLPDLTDKTLAGSQVDGAATDRAYNEVGFRLNTIIDAWHCVEKALNERVDAKNCLEGSR